MEHSMLIKQLRLNRGMTQEMLSKGITKRTTLASFENSSTRISYDTLVKYLDRMNITLEEYQFLLEDQTNSEKKKIATIYYKKMRQKFDENVILMLNDAYNKSEEKYYLLLKAEYILVMNKKFDILQSEFESSKLLISNYLDSIETWGRFELSIFINTLFCYDDIFIWLHYKKSIKKMKGYNDNLYYSRDILAFLINGVQLTYERHSSSLFNEFMKDLKRLSDELNNVEADLVWKVFSFLTSNDIYNAMKKYELFLVLAFLDKHNYIEYISNVLIENDFWTPEKA